jgi:hypothetical protein
VLLYTPFVNMWGTLGQDISGAFDLCTQSAQLTDLLEGLAGHEQGGVLGQGAPNGLGHEGDCAGGAGVRFNDVHLKHRTRTRTRSVTYTRRERKVYKIRLSVVLRV